MLPYINIGSIGLPTSPLAIIFGAWLSLYLVDRAARRLGRDSETYYGVASTALVAGFVGARLTFVLLHWPSYDDNLMGILWPLNSGYNGLGGVLIGSAAAFFYGRWKQLPLWPTLDILAPGLIGWLITLSLADFLGGSGYGAITNLPWGVNSFGVRRHPVQLYEILAGLLSLGSWWWVTAEDRQSFAGRPFLVTMAVYAAGRLFVEAFSKNAWLTASGLHVIQIISLVVMLAALGGLAWLATRGTSVAVRPEVK